MITENVDQQEMELLEAERIAAISIEYARSFGVKLPDVVLDLTEWVTLKRYAEEHQLSIQVLTNWVNRGIIPQDCTQVVPELNDLRLIKNITYK